MSPILSPVFCPILTETIPCPSLQFAFLLPLLHSASFMKCIFMKTINRGVRNTVEQHTSCHISQSGATDRASCHILFIPQLAHFCCVISGSALLPSLGRMYFPATAADSNQLLNVNFARLQFLLHMWSRQLLLYRILKTTMDLLQGIQKRAAIRQHRQQVEAILKLME